MNDFLNKCKNEKKVMEVEMNMGRVLTGVIICFDDFQNLTLQNGKITYHIKGSAIKNIKIK